MSEERRKDTRNVRVSENFRDKYSENHPMTLMIGNIIEVHPNSGNTRGTFGWTSTKKNPSAWGTEYWDWEEDWLEFL